MTVAHPVQQPEADLEALALAARNWFLGIVPSSVMSGPWQQLADAVSSGRIRSTDAIGRQLVGIFREHARLKMPAELTDLAQVLLFCNDLAEEHLIAMAGAHLVRESTSYMNPKTCIERIVSHPNATPAVWCAVATDANVPSWSLGLTKTADALRGIREAIDIEAVRRFCIRNSTWDDAYQMFTERAERSGMEAMLEHLQDVAVERPERFPLMLDETLESHQTTAIPPEAIAGWLGSPSPHVRLTTQVALPFLSPARPVQPDSGQEGARTPARAPVKRPRLVPSAT